MMLASLLFFFLYACCTSSSSSPSSTQLRDSMCLRESLHLYPYKDPAMTARNYELLQKSILMSSYFPDMIVIPKYDACSSSYIDEYGMNPAFREMYINNKTLDLYRHNFLYVDNDNSKNSKASESSSQKVKPSAPPYNPNGFH
jgi:hypothetical protein